jgi:hypothetical protein
METVIISIRGQLFTGAERDPATFDGVLQQARYALIGGNEFLAGQRNLHRLAGSSHLDCFEHGRRVDALVEMDEKQWVRAAPQKKMGNNWSSLARSLEGQETALAILVARRRFYPGGDRDLECSPLGTGLPGWNPIGKVSVREPSQRQVPGMGRVDFELATPRWTGQIG